jgi:hypothetical protein
MQSIVPISLSCPISSRLRIIIISIKEEKTLIKHFGIFFSHASLLKAGHDLGTSCSI